jgi:hypothetical protein
LPRKRSLSRTGKTPATPLTRKRLPASGSTRRRGSAARRACAPYRRTAAGRAPRCRPLPAPPAAARDWRCSSNPAGAPSRAPSSCGRSMKSMLIRPCPALGPLTPRRAGDIEGRFQAGTVAPLQGIAQFVELLAVAIEFGEQAVRLARQMSRHISGWLAAMRVKSRKPLAAKANSRSRLSRRASSCTSANDSRCGRWLTAAKTIVLGRPTPGSLPPQHSQAERTRATLCGCFPARASAPPASGDRDRPAPRVRHCFRRRRSGCAGTNCPMRSPKHARARRQRRLPWCCRRR